MWKLSHCNKLFGFHSSFQTFFFSFISLVTWLVRHVTDFNGSVLNYIQLGNSPVSTCSIQSTPLVFRDSESNLRTSSRTLCMRCRHVHGFNLHGKADRKWRYINASSGLRTHATDSILLGFHKSIRLTGIHLISFLGFVHRIIFIETSSSKRKLCHDPTVRAVENATE